MSTFEKDKRCKEGKFIVERCKIHSGRGDPLDRIQLWAEHVARTSESMRARRMTRAPHGRHDMTVNY